MIDENDNCFDVKFLKCMPNVKELAFSHNKIECINHLSVLQYANRDVQWRRLLLQKNNLVSFDFADLIATFIFLVRAFFICFFYMLFLCAVFMCFFYKCLSFFICAYLFYNFAFFISIYFFFIKNDRHI